MFSQLNKMFFKLALFLFIVGVALGNIPSFTYEGPWIQNWRPKIVNGTDAPAGQHPYVVSLNYVSNGKHAGGASVLTQNALLTAAHVCLAAQGDEMYVYAGSQILSSGGMNFSISEMHVHEKYQGGANNDYYEHDVCVMTLESPLPLGDSIAQVPLTKPNVTINDGEEVVLVGWGWTTQVNATGTIPDILQKLNSVAWSNVHCNEVNSFPILPGHLCARATISGSGACAGDSGSPLTWKGAQVGVASFIALPCGSAVPNFFARIPYYIDWIQDKLGEEAKNVKFIDH